MGFKSLSLNSMENISILDECLISKEYHIKLGNYIKKKKLVWETNNY